MKKIISLISAVTMIFSLAVSVSANEKKLTVNTEILPLSEEEYIAIYGEAAPEGYEGYNVIISLSDFGELSTTKAGVNINGRRINNFTHYMTFDDPNFEVVNTDYTYAYDSVLDPNLSNPAWMTDGTPTYKCNFGGTKNTAYPKTKTTEAITTVENAFSVLLTIKKGASVKVTFGANATFATYTSGVNADEPVLAAGIDDRNTINLSPATITLGTPSEDKTVTTEIDKTNGATKIKYGADVPAAEQTLKDKYIVKSPEIAPKGDLTAASRVVVEYKDGDSPLNKVVEYGHSLFKILGLTGDGAVNARAIQFGIVYDNAQYKADKFTFTIK